MSEQAIDEALASLAIVAQGVIAEASAADAEAEALDDACEELLKQREADGTPLCQPNPKRALVVLRSTLAQQAASRHRVAAREFTAWWADLAMLAVVAAATGGRLHPARAAAADPTIWFSDEDLQQLPEIPQFDRDLVRLAAAMGNRPAGPGMPGDDLGTQAIDHASRVGLRLTQSDDSEIAVEEDGMPQGRRCRLWGEAWREAQVPALPSTDELAALLASRRVDATAVAIVREVTEAVHDAVDARRQARELDDQDPETPLTADQIAEIDSLWESSERLTDLLVQYARALTDVLPAVRAASG